MSADADVDTAYAAYLHAAARHSWTGGAADVPTVGPWAGGWAGGSARCRDGGREASASEVAAAPFPPPTAPPLLALSPRDRPRLQLTPAEHRALADSASGAHRSPRWPATSGAITSRGVPTRFPPEDARASAPPRTDWRDSRPISAEPQQGYAVAGGSALTAPTAGARAHVSLEGVRLGRLQKGSIAPSQGAPAAGTARGLSGLSVTPQSHLESDGRPRTLKEPHGAVAVVGAAGRRLDRRLLRSAIERVEPVRLGPYAQYEPAADVLRRISRFHKAVVCKAHAGRHEAKTLSPTCGIAKWHGVAGAAHVEWTAPPTAQELARRSDRALAEVRDVVAVADRPWKFERSLITDEFGMDTSL